MIDEMSHKLIRLERLVNVLPVQELDWLLEPALGTFAASAGESKIDFYLQDTRRITILLSTLERLSWE